MDPGLGPPPMLKDIAIIANNEGLLTRFLEFETVVEKNLWEVGTFTRAILPRHKVEPRFVPRKFRLAGGPLPILVSPRKGYFAILRLYLPDEERQQRSTRRGSPGTSKR